MRDIEFRDFLLHTYILGKTGKGKSNLLLHITLNFMKPSVQKEHPCSVIVIDPHGDLAFDIAASLKDWNNRLILIDPTNTRIGFNPLQPFVAPTNEVEKVSMLQNQVSQLTQMLADVMKTSVDTAPRLTWIFRGSLYFLYSFPQYPTFFDLYHLMSDLASRKKNERLTRDEFITMLKDVKAPDELLIRTMDAISNLDTNAYTPVMNRIANYVMPEHSYTSRTFCVREGKLPFLKMLEPGNLTIFRLAEHDLPADFRELFASTLVLKLYFLIMERAKIMQAEGKEQEARTPVFLIIDEFQMIQNLDILETIITEARKYGLYLILSHQNTAQIRNPRLLEAILGNVGMIISFGVGKDDAQRLSNIFGKELEKKLMNLGTGEMWVWRSPPKGGGPTASIDKMYVLPPPKKYHSLKEIIDYMKGPMEQLYGGAIESRSPIYDLEIAKFRAEKGLPGLEPVEWNILTFLRQKELGSVTEVLHRYVQQHLENMWGWNKTVIADALLRLEKKGLIISRATIAETIYKGRDELGYPIYAPPTTEDEKERAITVAYQLTDKARDEYFLKKIHSTRAGGPWHIKAIETYKEKFERRGLWVEVDYGEYRRQRPDMVVFEPVKIVKEVKPGEEEPSVTWAPDRWDYMNSVAYEFESNPRKHQKQLIENYIKNAIYHTRSSEEPRLFFIVPLASMIDEVKKYIEPVLDQDKPNYAVQKAELGLPEDKIEKLLQAEEEVNITTEVVASPSASSLMLEKEEEKENEPVLEQVTFSGSDGGKVSTEQATPMEEPKDKTVEKMQEVEPVQAELQESASSNDEVKPYVEEKKEVLQEKQQSDTQVLEGSNTAEQEIEKEEEEVSFITKQREYREHMNLRRQKLSPEAKKKMVQVLLIIAMNKGENTSNKIASILGLSSRQALRYLHDLEEQGLIREEKKKYFITDKGKEILG